MTATPTRRKTRVHKHTSVNLRERFVDEQHKKSAVDAACSARGGRELIKVKASPPKLSNEFARLKGRTW
jgi:hypothetical protein